MKYKRNRWKSDNTEIARRVDFIAREILEGESHAGIVRYCAENWGIESRQASNYLRRANTKIRKEAEKMMKSLLPYHLTARRNLMKEARDFGDRRLAFDVLRDEAKLLGLYAPEKLDVTWREIAASEGIDVDTFYPGIVEDFMAAMVAADDAGGSAGSTTESGGGQEAAES